jgi:small-conductance mechanosensitive channel
MKRDPFKTGAYALLTILIVILTVRECTRPGKPLPPSIQVRQDTIRLDEAQIKSYEAQFSVLAHERDSIEQNAKSREKAFKIENRHMSEKLAEARREAPPSVLTEPIVAIQDTVIHQQAARIDELEKIQAEKDANFTASLKVMELKFNAQKDISDQLTAINQDLYKALNRERRRGKVWKVAVPVALVVGFLIGEEL